MNRYLLIVVITSFLTTYNQGLGFAESKEDLAKKLANPVASLISLPFDYDSSSNLGSNDEGEQWSLTTKPVIPFRLNEDWNLIQRSIFAYIDLDYPTPGTGSKEGVSDLQVSFFLSPKEATHGIIWGAGPVLVFPTASDSLLGTEKYSVGPTAAALVQQGQWTFGALTQHLWSFAGEDGRDDVNTTLLQPFISYTSKSATNLTLQTEAVYDWSSDELSVPISLTVGQVLQIGNQLIQLRGGPRYWAKSIDHGAKGWGVKLGVVFLFPK